MSYKAKSNNLRISSIYNWPNRLIESGFNTKNKFNSSLYTNIQKFLISILTKNYKGFKQNNAIITTGTTHIVSYLKGLTIYINFFFDLKLAADDHIKELKIKLKKAKGYLSKTLGVNVTFILNNLYIYLWKYELYNNCTDKASLQAIKLAKDSNLYYFKEADYFNKIRYDLIDYNVKFKFFEKNQYFLRVMQPFFVLFNHRQIDCKILSSVIAFELGSLRKGHKQFLLFVKSIIQYLYDKNKNHITSVKIIIKGRLTLQNRQNRRKQKKIISFGKINNSKRDFLIFDANSLAFNRFGLINVVFSYSCLRHKRSILVKNEKEVNGALNNYYYIKAVLIDNNLLKTKFNISNFLKNRIKVSSYKNKNYLNVFKYKDQKSLNIKQLNAFLLNIR